MQRVSFTGEADVRVFPDIRLYAGAKGGLVDGTTSEWGYQTHIVTYYTPGLKALEAKLEAAFDDIIGV